MGRRVNQSKDTDTNEFVCLLRLDLQSDDLSSHNRDSCSDVQTQFRVSCQELTPVQHYSRGSEELALFICEGHRKKTLAAAREYLD